jgi:uncharacterized protein YndB with AHSA1/START domain
VTRVGAPIERELTIAARPETVWEFLVDPDKATAWMGLGATLDATPGGVYRVEVVPGEVAAGEFVEVDPPRRLVWTWGWEPGRLGDVPPGSTTVEVDLTPHPDGTHLRFRHHDVPAAEATGRHEEGWDHYLERLSLAASGAGAGEDPWIERRPG